jgi:hypothetical protein
MKITQRFCKNEIQFVNMVDAIVADGFDVFSICQSLDGTWHAWIRISDEGQQEPLDVAMRRGFDEFHKVERSIEHQKRLGAELA